MFPTKHDRGGLTLCHGGGEWTFDSSNDALRTCKTFSDVEHEVSSLTYNLYLPTESATHATPPVPIPSMTETTFKDALSVLLTDDIFMEEGRFLEFGLHHEYPLDPKAGLGNLINCLKGCDAIIQRVCSQLSLQTFLL